MNTFLSGAVVDISSDTVRASKKVTVYPVENAGKEVSQLHNNSINIAVHRVTPVSSPVHARVFNRSEQVNPSHNKAIFQTCPRCTQD